MLLIFQVYGIRPVTVHANKIIPIIAQLWYDALDC